MPSRIYDLNDLHNNPPLITFLHTTRPTRRLFTTTLRLVELIIFLIPAYGSAATYMDFW